MALNLALIVEREYMERVKRKSFIITTILVPLVMVALMCAPAFFLMLGGTEKKTVQVVDQTGLIAGRLAGNDDIEFAVAGEPVDSLRSNEDVEAILIIGPDAVADPSHGLTLLTRGSVSMMTDAYVSSQIKGAIEDVRLEQTRIPGLKQIIEDIKTDVNLATVRMDTDKDTATSSELSYFLSLAMDMMLYMFIIIYGQMVMTSIIEEKNNRVLEIVVSSVKPFDLMMGKIIGVGLVAITQILIWALIIGVAAGVGSPFLMHALESDPDTSTGVVAAVGEFTDPGFLITLFISVLLYFIGGFLFYASIYAAIGSAVSNVQDASQLSTIATLPVILGIIASMAIINDPSSQLAFWVSMIPFTSPMVMMARMPYGVPAWEVVLSLALLYASFVFMIWACAKIYRVGIFMYGKKPTITEVIRWARYK